MKIKDFYNSLNEELTPLEEMKKFFKSLAAELNLDEGNALPPQVVTSRAIGLNPKQRDAIVSALEELVEEGVFEETDNGNIALTAKGKDLIY